MALRPVYIIEDSLVKKLDINFKWFAGFSISQKQKSIESLHEETCKITKIPKSKIIEISSASKLKLGINLSAFNLRTKTKTNKIDFSVESAFQSSKVFEHGGPFKEIINFDSKSAKTDKRLKESGKLLYFEFFGKRYPIEDKTAFYDWLYINILLKNPKYIKTIMKYRAFSDIMFNPKKSLNTQAFSIALFVCLQLTGIDMSNFKDYQTFLKESKPFYPN